MSEKQIYVEMERTDGKKIWTGFDTYVMPWPDFTGPTICALEEAEVGESVTVKYTIRELTDDEFSALADNE